MFTNTSKQKITQNAKPIPQTQISTNQTVLFLGLAVASVLWLNAQASETGINSEFAASAQLAELESQHEHSLMRNHFPTDRENTIPLTVRGDEPIDAHAASRNHFSFDRSNSIPVTSGSEDKSEHALPRNNFKY